MLTAYSEIQTPEKKKKHFRNVKYKIITFLGYSVTSSEAPSSQQPYCSGCLFVGMQRFSFYTLSYSTSES